MKQNKIIVILAVIVIALLSFEVWRFENIVNKEYKRQLRLIDSKIKQKDSTLLVIKKKVSEIQKKDSIQQRKINYLKWKLKKYEKKTDINHINSLARDSVRAILTH